MTRSMFGISLSPDADILRPFRAYVSWLCHLIGLHPILMYDTPSGPTLHSPESSTYTNDGFRLFDKTKNKNITSPERALYLNDGCSPSDRERTTITSPERAKYNNVALSPIAIKIKAL